MELMIIIINFKIKIPKKILAKIIKEYIGWEKNTTYTVIKRLIDKGAVSREDPGFLCRAQISKKEVQRIETEALFSKMFNNSLSIFINDYLGQRKLTTEEIIELQRMINHNQKMNSGDMTVAH